MDKSEIHIIGSIAHILDAGVGEPFFSNQKIFMGSDFSDFLKDHIVKIATSDDSKACSFYENESRVFQILKDFSEENFVAVSLDIAAHLFEIMKENIDIPAADLMLVHYRYNEKQYLAILKMNYKVGFTHQSQPSADGNDLVDIIPFRALLPQSGQKLSEAAIIDLETKTLSVVEKKFAINGVKTNYFSKMFLNCSSSLSPKSRLAIVNRAIEEVRDDFTPDLDTKQVAKERMETKKAIFRELEKTGTIDVPKVIEKVFEASPQMAQAAKEKVEKYNIDKAPIAPKSDRVVKKYGTQVVATDTGVELKIPMDQYEDANAIEFIQEEDGRLTIVIKNIGSIVAR